MEKGIPKKMNLDTDFSHRYAGGINQYGTKGAQSSEEFQGYMNDGLMQQNAANKAPTPMNIMSSPTNPNFGPPAPSQPGTLQGAAPENFGPPGTGMTESSNQPNFGPPGFSGESAKPPEQKVGNEGTSIAKNQPTFGAPQETNAPSLADEGTNVGLTNEGQDQVNKGGSDGGKPKKTRKQVEKMMADQMIQNAIAIMRKMKQSDVWKE